MLRALFISISLVLAGGLPGVWFGTALAQDLPAELPAPDPVIVPDAQPDVDLPSEAPDYSRLSPSAEREARLDDLFDRLAFETDTETAALIAEDITAIWQDSGSASVNLVLRRGADAQGKGDKIKARVMYDHATSLQPDYAEGWARSARLALENGKLSRALNESIAALAIEPRHVFALWTMGNAFEQLGRTEEALEAYREAVRLYPELSAAKSRVEALEGDVEGTVL